MLMLRIYIQQHNNNLGCNTTNSCGNKDSPALASQTSKWARGKGGEAAWKPHCSKHAEEFADNGCKVRLQR